MKNLRELLAMDDSLIGQSLRSTLYGLEDFLRKTSERFPQDPGANRCNAALQELQSLLQLSSPDSPDNQSRNIIVNPTKDSYLKDLIAPDELQLSVLRDEFHSDKDLIKYLGNFQLRSQTDADLWKEIQYNLLRVPKEMANSWKARALKLARDAQAEADESNIQELRFENKQELYPGLRGSVQINGLSLSKSKNAFLDSQVLQEDIYEDLSENLKSLACLVSICIYFIDVQPDLYHALEALSKFDFMPLYSNENQRGKYIDTLRERFQRAIRTEKSKEILETLKAWIKIDEAINSLVFKPIADSNSFFGALQKKSRSILFNKFKEAREKGHTVRMQELSEQPYSSIYSLSSGNYDLPLDAGGTPGYVQACLRVYARIGQEEFKGRVVFRKSD